MGDRPLLRWTGSVAYRDATSSAPVCALGHLPLKGKAALCCSGLNEGARRIIGTTPHPPQCAHWGTFPSRGRLCGGARLSLRFCLSCRKRRLRRPIAFPWRGRWTPAFNPAAWIIQPGKSKAQPGKIQSTTRKIQSTTRKNPKHNPGQSKAPLVFYRKQLYNQSIRRAAENRPPVAPAVPYKYIKGRFEKKQPRLKQ